MVQLWKPHVLSFSSGGVRVIGHMGVIAALHDCETNILSDVKEWWGCSGGSLCALVGVLGVTSQWLRDCVTVFDLRPLGIPEEDLIADFFQKWGINSGNAWTEYIGKILETWEPGISSWTFADLATHYPNASLHIIATNLTRGSLAVFSAETTPTTRLLDALRASCSVPLFYIPWQCPETGDLFCDGAVLEQYPWTPIQNKDGTLVIACSESAIRFPTSSTSSLTSLSDYIGRIYQIARKIPVGMKNWIAVNNKTVGILEFDVTSEKRLALFEEGISAAHGWLRFRSIIMQQGSSQQMPCMHLDSVPLHTLPSSHYEPDKTSEIPLFHKQEDGTYPLPDPDIGKKPSYRRWSL